MMSQLGLKSSDILEPLIWPDKPWEDHYEFVVAKNAVDGQEMDEAEATLVSYLDVQQLERLRADISLDLKGHRKGLTVTIALRGSVLRRCVLSGEMLREEIDTKDRFDFIRREKNESEQKKIEAQVSEDLGTGLDDGPDVWNEKYAPTLVGLIADCLEEILEPTPKIEGAQVAMSCAQDPKETELSEKTHPFAALKALKKTSL